MKEKERFEVLLEHMDRKIDVVLESHQSLDQKIETGLEEARIDRESMKRQMSLFVQTLSGKIDQNREGIEKNREGIEKNREGIEKNREVIEKNREGIERNRLGIEKNREGIEQVNQKVDINRKKIEEIDDKLSSGLESYEDHEKRIRVLEAVN